MRKHKQKNKVCSLLRKINEVNEQRIRVLERLLKVKERTEDAQDERIKLLSFNLAPLNIRRLSSG